MQTVDLFLLFLLLPAEAAPRLVYGDVGGRRVLGPHYDDLKTLSVCAYSPQDRISTFKGSATYAQATAEALPPLATLHWAAWHGHAYILDNGGLL